MVTPGGVIDTVAGNGETGRGGEGLAALEAALNGPAGLAVDAGGAVYFADRLNHRIRQLTLAAPAPPPGVEQPPAVQTIQALHAATLRDGPLVPGMLLSLKGADIGPSAPTSGIVNEGTLVSSLAGVVVTFNGAPAPILYAQRNLINVQAPYEIAAAADATIEIRREGILRGALTLPVQAVLPGIFTSGAGAGPAVALNEDYQLNAPDNPAPRGGVLTFFATGDGAATPAIATGQTAPPTPPVPAADIQVTVGGHAADILSLAAGAASPGVLQVSIVVPVTAGTGALPLLLTANGVSSQPAVTVFVK